MPGRYRLVKLGIGTSMAFGLLAVLIWPKPPSNIVKAVPSKPGVTHRNYIPTASDPTPEDARRAGKAFLDLIGIQDVDASEFHLESYRTSKSDRKRPVWRVGYKGHGLTYDMAMRQVVQYWNSERNWYPGKKFRRAEQQQIPKERGPKFVSALARRLGMPNAQELEFEFGPEEGNPDGDPVICTGFVRLSA